MFPRPVEERLATFPEGQRAVVRDVLPRREDFSDGAPYERVLLAVLDLAGQDTERVRHFAAAATRDWRDVVYWAEHPRDSSEPQSWDDLKRRLRRPDL